MDPGRRAITPLPQESSPDNNAGGGWRFFEKIYCISLEERTDRRDAARREFQRVGLSGLVEFVIVKKHDHNCECGIFESHLACLTKGLAAGAETVLVFEDDILFDGFDPLVLDNCVHFMKTDAGWEAFFFGCLARKTAPTPHPSVVAVRYRSLAHAYVVRRAFARKIVRQVWQERPFDAVLGGLLGNGFAARPAFAFQSDAPSDNTRRNHLERFRNLFGGLRRIQKANEFYHGHKTVIITGHLAALAAMLLFLL
jgi:GR25 family glycosyltransferase involved in LPS biosynthesis